MKNNNFTIPLFSWYYVGITLVFILMKYLEIIDWAPLWLLCPLWLPSAIVFFIIFILFFLKLVILSIEIIIFKKRW